MSRFTTDNTEGYTGQQLAELNDRYETKLILTAILFEVDKSMADRIAERVQADYDTELSAAPATEEQHYREEILDNRPRKAGRL